MSTKPRRTATMQEVEERLLKAGKVTKKGLEEAQRVLDADPEIQAARLGESIHVLAK